MDAQINSHNSTVHALIHCLGSKYERSSHIFIKRRNTQGDRETKRGDREMEKHIGGMKLYYSASQAEQQMLVFKCTCTFP